MLIFRFFCVSCICFHSNFNSYKSTFVDSVFPCLLFRRWWLSPHRYKEHIAKPSAWKTGEHQSKKTNDLKTGHLAMWLVCPLGLPMGNVWPWVYPKRYLPLGCTAGIGFLSMCLVLLGLPGSKVEEEKVEMETEVLSHPSTLWWEYLPCAGGFPYVSRGRGVQESFFSHWIFNQETYLSPLL